jgi:hypothetical protein
VARLIVENLEGRDLMTAGVVTGIASDGLGTTWPYSVVQAAEGRSVIGAEAQANGIIAILIGLRSPDQPATGLLHGDFAKYETNVTSSFQGGCANQGSDARGANG